MTDFLQLLFSGLATGAIYGLAALGFTLLWPVSYTHLTLPTNREV